MSSKYRYRIAYSFAFSSKGKVSKDFLSMLEECLVKEHGIKAKSFIFSKRKLPLVGIINTFTTDNKKTVNTAHKILSDFEDNYKSIFVYPIKEGS